jgi:hypothetical protein
MAARFESTNPKKTLAIGAPKLMHSWLCKLSAVKISTEEEKSKIKP